MNKILAAILLATTVTAANAEPRQRKLQVMCGSFEEVEITINKYGEKLIMATQAPNEKTVNLVYVNFDTETTSWFVHDLETDEYCMVGVGKRIYIPDSNGLKQGIGLETRINYK